MPMIVMSAENYMRMYRLQSPNMWPVYFGARMAAQTVQDLLMKKMQTEDIELLKQNIDLMLGTSFTAAYEQKAGGDTGDVTKLRSTLETLYTGLYDNWKAGIWKGVGAAYSNAIDNFLNTGQLLYAYKTLMYHTAITPRMRRQWMKTFTPTVPNASMAYILFKRGKITESEFKTYCSYEGWDGKGIDQLRASWEAVPTVYVAFELMMRGELTRKQFEEYVDLHSWPAEWRDLLYRLMERLPTPHEAFYLWTKGLIDRAARDELYKAGGFDESWHQTITDNWYYTPTLYDLVRMADYIELDQIWAADVMTRRGIKTADQAKIWEMLQLRPLREETRAVTTKWIWRMRYGRTTLETLDDEFKSLGIKTKERELLLMKAQMDYEDELIDEMIEVLRWRFRTAIITEAQFLNGLLDLEIRQEKANLIVEEEKARGYYGYY